MEAVGRAIKFACGVLMGIVGLALLALGLWVTDIAYFDLLGTGIHDPTFSIHGRSIPVSVLVAALGITSSVLLTFGAVITKRNNLFTPHTSST